MRGLTGPRGGRIVRGGRRRARRAAGPSAAAALAALGLFAAGCSSSGSGLQDEGSARAEAPAATSAAPSPPNNMAKVPADVDPVKLIKSDPKVAAQVKAQLKPCVQSAYPVDTSYGNVTGGDLPDIVVNVMTCADGIGLGTYVYRADGAAYENVFSSEKAAVYASIDRGDLVVTQQVYTEKDPVASPSAEEVTTYHWSGGKFSKLYWVRNEFSTTLGDELAAPWNTVEMQEN